MEAMGGNGWQQHKQRMCIDQVQNQRTTKEENSCTRHMHFTCARLVVHIKLERSSCSLSVHVLLLSVPLSCTSLYFLYALSRGFLVWWVFLVFFLCNGQFSIWKKMCKNPSKTDQSVCVDIQIPQLDRGIWMFTQIDWCLFTPLCQCHLEPETTIGLSSFCLGYIFWSTKFKHFAKDASIFHLKLWVAMGLVIFQLSPLQDTPLISTADLL